MLQILKCYGCCKCCGCDEALEKERAKSMDFEEIKERANELNRFLLIQIKVCEHLKKEEKKPGETSKLKGTLLTIKKNYKELVNILNK